MIGNDVDEDIIASTSVGFNAFLLTDCIINKQDKDISQYPHGGFHELAAYLNL